MYSIPLHIRFGRTGWLLLFIAGYCILAIAGLKAYIEPFSINCILGATALLLTINTRKTSSRSWRFSLLALLFAILYLLIPAKTILFASIAMSVFVMVETFGGRLNHLSVASLILMSPIADYAVNLFSFPIRLGLTSVAGKMLQIIHPETTAEGNMIVTKSTEFSVDPACMGLHMLVTSLLTVIILVSIIQKKKSRKMTIPGFLMCMLLIVLLNVISNLFRILCLVNFNIGPNSFMHGVTGMACFFVYVIAPALFYIPQCLSRFGKNNGTGEAISTRQISNSQILLNALLMTFTIGIVFSAKERSVNENIQIQPVSIPGYSTHQLADRITKLENEQALVYIKPIAGFYSSDHQPMICWKGSGYEFKKVREKRVGNYHVYDAVLEKEKEVLYTAWWYDNGVSSTISQFEWRWDSFRNGGKYALVNVTTTTEDALEKEISKLLILKPFSKMFIVN